MKSVPVDTARVLVETPKDTTEDAKVPVDAPTAVIEDARAARLTELPCAVILDVLIFKNDDVEP